MMVKITALGTDTALGTQLRNKLHRAEVTAKREHMLKCTSGVSTTCE